VLTPLIRRGLGTLARKAGHHPEKAVGRHRLRSTHPTLLWGAARGRRPSRDVGKPSPRRGAGVAAAAGEQEDDVSRAGLKPMVYLGCMRRSGWRSKRFELFGL